MRAGESLKTPQVGNLAANTIVEVIDIGNDAVGKRIRVCRIADGRGTGARDGWISIVTVDGTDALKLARRANTAATEVPVEAKVVEATAKTETEAESQSSVEVAEASLASLAAADLTSSSPPSLPEITHSHACASSSSAIVGTGLLADKGDSTAAASLASPPGLLAEAGDSPAAASLASSPSLLVDAGESTAAASLEVDPKATEVEAQAKVEAEAEAKIVATAIAAARTRTKAKAEARAAAERAKKAAEE